MSTQTPAEIFATVFERARSMDASVNERLGLIADTVRTLNPPFAEAVDQLVVRLQSTGAGRDAPSTGEPMPPFVLPDENGSLVSLESLLKKGPVAISFHRGSWCPFCRLNTIALAEAQSEAESVGAQLIAITPDRQHFTAELKAEMNAPFPILTDIDNGYSMSLNLAIWVGPEVYAFTAARFKDDPRFTESDSSMLPIPATFVVGTDGLIKARYIDPDYRKRMEIDDLLSALTAAG